MLLLVLLDARSAEGALSGGRRGDALTAGGRGGCYKTSTRTFDSRTGKSHLYMCRLSGPSRLAEDGPNAAGSEVTVPLLKGFEWSKTETAMDARVLAPKGPNHRFTF